MPSARRKEQEVLLMNSKFCRLLNRFSLIKVFVAPVSIKIFVLNSLTEVVINNKEGLDGFTRDFPETTPSADVSLVRNLDRPQYRVHFVDLHHQMMMDFLD